MRRALLWAPLSAAVAALLGHSPVTLVSEGLEFLHHANSSASHQQQELRSGGDENARDTHHEQELITKLSQLQSELLETQAKLQLMREDAVARETAVGVTLHDVATAYVPPRHLVTAESTNFDSVTGCLSHDVFNDISNAMNPVRIHAANRQGTSINYTITRLSILMILLLLSGILLMAPLLTTNTIIGVSTQALETRAAHSLSYGVCNVVCPEPCELRASDHRHVPPPLAVSSVGVQMLAYVQLFYFIFACSDAWTWDVNEPETFTMCVLPMSLAIVGATILGVMLVFFMKRVACLSVVVLGKAGGIFIMFLVRDIVLTTDDDLVNHRDMWLLFWLGTAAFGILCSLVALCFKELVYVTATVGVGSYVFASSIAGIILASGGTPIHFGWYILIYIAAGIAGIVAYLSVQPEPPLLLRTKLSGLPGLPAMKQDPAYGTVFA